MFNSVDRFYLSHQIASIVAGISSLTSLCGGACGTMLSGVASGRDPGRGLPDVAVQACDQWAVGTHAITAERPGGQTVREAPGRDRG